MRDEVITYMRQRAAASHDQPFFVDGVPGGRCSPQNPTKEWIGHMAGRQA